MSTSDNHKPAVKRFKRVSAPASMHLTDRDVAVLEALASHRLLSTVQLQRLVFQCSESRVCRRLRLLYDHGFVERVSVVAQPSKGVPAFVYVLAKRGTAALADIGVATPRGPSRTGGVEFVRHRLEVNNFFITLTEAIRGTDYRLADWRHEQALKLPTADGRGRAEVVRHATLAKPMSFLPDAYFELQISPDQSLAFFVEIDMATHAQRIWRERARLYTAYANPQLELFSRRFERQTFRLLIVTTPDYRRRSRCANIVSSILQTVGSSDLFLATTFDQIIPDQLFGPIWRQPGSEARRSLLTNPGGQRRSRVTVQPKPNTIKVTRRQDHGTT